MFGFLDSAWSALPYGVRTTSLIVSKIAGILLPLLLAVAYLTFLERKAIGYMQVRVGPNRVGPRGWLQPIADAIKLLLKEVIVPTSANRALFFSAPVLSVAPALAVWAVYDVLRAPRSFLWSFFYMIALIMLSGAIATLVGGAAGILLTRRR